jgi:hypothetical protein
MKNTPYWTMLTRGWCVVLLGVPSGCLVQGDIGGTAPRPTSDHLGASDSAVDGSGDTAAASSGAGATWTTIDAIAATGGVDATSVSRSPHDMNMTPAMPPRLTPEHHGTFPTDAVALAKRAELIQFLWGADGFPSEKLPWSIETKVASPVSGLANLERVDTLHIRMDAGIVSLAHHFIPAAGKRNRMVIVHHGHATTFNDQSSLEDVGYGLQRTINNLLLDGYSVMAMYMPGCLPPDPGCTIDHQIIVNTPTTGSGMKFFLEPVAEVLNYLETQADADGFPHYKDFNMVGLSGGGWTTTVYAALDPRIKISVQVAGTLPLSLRSGFSVGDEEQTHADFYNIAGYTDLYVLGAYGVDRRQVQVLIRHDNCCLGESLGEYDPAQTGMSWDDALRGYELEVRQKLSELKLGSFRLEIDETAPGHMFSWNTIASTILGELDGSRRVAWVGSGQRFERADDGTLVRLGPDGTEHTGFPMVGVPAVKQRADGGYDVFFREPKSKLVHAWSSSTGWTVEPLQTLVITDPVLTTSGSGDLEVAALTANYLPRYWSAGTGPITSEAIDTAPRGFGPPLLSSDANGSLEVFLRGWDHVAYRLYEDGTSSSWMEEIISQLPKLSSGFTATHHGPTMP